MSWRDQAACRGTDTDLFVHESDDDGRRGQPPVEAMRICMDCPVRLPCFEAGMNDEGVWGGTTARNRLDVRMGRMTVTQAWTAGDRIAQLRTRAEQQADAEPWLGVSA